MKKISMNQQGAWAISLLVAGVGYGIGGTVLMKGAKAPESSHGALRADAEDDEGEGHGGHGKPEGSGAHGADGHGAAQASEGHGGGHGTAKAHGEEATHGEHGGEHDAKADAHEDAHGGGKSEAHGETPKGHGNAKSAKAGHAGPHWSYQGETGPARWGSLSPDYALCERGTEQSPINLTAAIPVRSGKRLAVHYAPGKVRVFNNGHTIQADYPAGSYVEVDDKRYDLVQFHFHTPSEHHVNGKSVPLEAHFVHKAKGGELAVIGVMLDDDARRSVFAPVLSDIPATPSSSPKLVSFDAAKALPRQRDHYTYPGSLTTPPCSEGVLWMVMTEYGHVSPSEFTAFHEIFPANARPIQPSRDRLAH